MDSSGESLMSSYRVELDLPPSCIEFCPTDPRYLLVGTYNLQKDETAEVSQDDEEKRGDDSSGVQGTKKAQSRNGSLVVFRVSEQGLTLVHTKTLPSAVLDLHFQPHRSLQDVCGVVTSTGTLYVFKFAPSESGPEVSIELKDRVRLPGIGDDVLFLSLAWHPSMENVAAVTTSQGLVYLIRRLGNDGPWISTKQPLISHSLEAWCVAFSPGDVRQGSSVEEAVKDDTFTLYSGGDDSDLRYVSCSLETPLSAEDDALDVAVPFPPARIQGHGAGVTAILPLSMTTKDGSAVVLTGSYDDHIRVFAITPLHETFGVRRCRLLAEHNLGGGVWRLKLIDPVGEPQAAQEDRQGSWTAVVLASCMHAGARIVRIYGDYEGQCSIHLLARFEEHKSMNYGCDFQPGRLTDDLVSASCSFYDRLLCLWRTPRALLVSTSEPGLAAAAGARSDTGKQAA